MRYEWLIGLRYLMSTRRRSSPSVITLIAVGGVAVGVATLLVVLAVLGGFEGDLRDKILGAKAHLRITGPSEAPLVAHERVLEALERLDRVVGAAPFIESELLVSSPTNYSGVILRGIDVDRARQASDLAENIVEGDLDWLEDPETARREIDAESDGEAAALRERIERLREETRALQREIDDARRARGEELPGGAETPSDIVARLEAIDAARGTPRIPAQEEDGATEGEDFEMPPLPPPARGSRAEEEDDTLGEEGYGMPPLPPPALGVPHGSGYGHGNGGDGYGDDGGNGGDGYGDDGGYGDDDDGMPSLPAPRGPQERVGASRIPGIVLGSQLRDVLRVQVGDVVNLISPDGDMGPSGPVPRSRPFRVVGVFHSGLFEFDNRMAYVTLPESRSFLNIPAEEVTGVEVRLERLHQAPVLAAQLGRILQAEGVDEVQVRDWQELNETLFAALALEKLVMFLILSIIILVASFAIVCMLIVIVIEKSREIAILKSMGAPRRGVMGIFLVEGGVVGLAGTLVGLALGLGVVFYLRQVGWPLDPEVFYIDRLPVELSAPEVVVVAAASISISLLATLYPSVQAARLDPVQGLRFE